jgi:hypothetical protein
MNLFAAVDHSLQALRHIEVLVAGTLAAHILEAGLAADSLERSLVDIGCTGPT